MDRFEEIVLFLGDGKMFLHIGVILKLIVDPVNKCNLQRKVYDTCHWNVGPEKMVLPRSQAVRFRNRVRLGSGDDMSTSECPGTSVMSRYGRIRSGNDLPDQTFRDRPRGTHT